MKACTPDATPMPPSSSATNPTNPRKLPSVLIASVTFASDSAAVFTRSLSFSSVGLLRFAQSVATIFGGILSSVSYEAREPKLSRRVSSSHCVEMNTRGPTMETKPASPGTCFRVPAITNVE